MRKVNIELEAKNGELQSEVKILQQKLLQAERALNQQSQKPTQKSMPDNKQMTDSRYSFSNVG